MNDTTLP